MKTISETMNCPNCLEEIDHLIRWETISAGYPIDFEGNSLNGGDVMGKDVRFSDCSDFEDIVCPKCSESVPIS